MFVRIMPAPRSSRLSLLRTSTRAPTIASLAFALSFAPAPARAQGSITGTVFDSLRTRAPLANATVVLVEQSRYVTTDTRGRFRIDSVADGHYTIGVVHPVLDSLDMQLPVVPVNVSDGRRITVALATPSPATAYARLCPGARDVETGVIVGLVRDVDERAPLSDAVVSTEWSEFTIATGGRASPRVGKRMTVQTRTDAAGLFLLCNVPTDTPVDVRSVAGAYVGGPLRLTIDGGLISRADFSISRQDAAARTLADSTTTDATTGAAGLSTGTPTGTAVLRGIVRRSDGSAAGGATIAVVGTTREARTDSTGAFVLTGIPAGTRTIEVRGIGTVPSVVSFEFATRQVRIATLQLGELAQALSAVNVNAAAGRMSFADRSGFSDRRKTGSGSFRTDRDIALHPYQDLTAVLATMPGVRVDQGTTGFPMPYFRGGSGLCIPTFIVDGVHFPVNGASPDEKVKYPYTDLSAIVRPESIKGIEVYSSLGAVPVQFDRTFLGGCGAIVIWTR